MPCLDTLASKVSQREFAKKVAANVERLSDQPVDVNGGVKTTAELKEHLIARRGTKFDYDRLIDESKSYQ